jgi:heat shock protein HslJ
MTILRRAALVLALSCPLVGIATAQADNGFPFGMDMQLETPPQPGSKRLPSLEIGDRGEAQLDLWCKKGKGQFSVANDTIVFVPGGMSDQSCSPAAAQADDALVNALTQATNWKRQGDMVSFVGPTTLRFRINTN